MPSLTKFQDTPGSHKRGGFWLNRGKGNRDLKKQELLEVIQRKYVTSREFNGWLLRGNDVPRLRQNAIELLEDELIQVVTFDDYMNIHIRPWTTRRTVEDQKESLVSLDSNDYGVCLYPTSKSMADYAVPQELWLSPFSLEMFRGKGSLEVAFFETGVLESYLNDPKFKYRQGDFGVDFYLTDEAYFSDLGLERDQVSLSHLGFAYNFEEVDISAYIAQEEVAPTFRRVCAFYCDLSKLTPEHQQRWRSFEVSPAGLLPHPVWWGMQMGKWADGLGPFDRLFVEIGQLNELTHAAFGQRLFRETSRPEELGWMLQPTHRGWGNFALALDKVLSDNLNAKFFDSQGVETLDEEGKRMGTLRRLESYLMRHGVDQAAAKALMKPFKDVRKERQSPAHKIQENQSDPDYFYKQISLINEVNNSLWNLREWLRSHPLNREFVDKYEDMKTYHF